MIVLQEQPTFNTCVCTCLAMLARLPVEEVVAKYHDRYWKKSSQLLSIMHELYITGIPGSSAFATLHWGQVYMLSVPSLSRKVGTHQIIADLSDWETEKIYDPASGDKYTVELLQLHGWVIDFRILDCPAMRK